MPIVYAWYADLATAGGPGQTSHTLSWRFEGPLSLTAQAAVGGLELGGIDPGGGIGANREGSVSHTHEVIYFGAEQLSEESLQEEAVSAARSLHPGLDEELSASMSTRAELERLRSESAGRQQRRR